LGTPPGGSSDFAYRALTFCGRPFHAGSAIRELCNSLTVRQNGLVGPATPTWQRLPPLTPCRFGLFPVRSPLLGESRLFSLPQGTEMFQFPWFPLPALCVQAGVTRHDPCRVSLFGDPRIEACLAAPRGLSQPATSFIGFQRLGIHRVPFATCRDDARARYGVLKGRLPDRVAPSRTVERRAGLDARAAWFAGRSEGYATAAFKAAQCVRVGQTSGPRSLAGKRPIQAAPCRVGSLERR
jgi:hypothetical protein